MSRWHHFPFPLVIAHPQNSIIFLTSLALDMSLYVHVVDTLWG